MNYFKINKLTNGLTLLETLLYTAIVVIVAGLAVGTLLTTIRVQNTGTAYREVSEQARFIIEAMTREVRDSSLIDISTSTQSTKLVLRMGSTSRDYVAFYASGTSMWMDEGTSSVAQTIATTTTRLNTNKVSVATSTVSFIRIFNPPSKDAVQVSFTLYYNTNDKSVSSSSKQFITTLDRITSASIGDDLVPSANTLDVGQTSPQLRWKNVRLTDKLLIGVSNTRELTSGDIESDDRVVLGYTNGALKLLGTSTGEFLKFSNLNNNLTISIRNILGSSYEALRISSSTGNALVGVILSVPTDASEKLEVVGNIISKGTEWKKQITQLPDNNWYSVAYGNGRFVAVASSIGGSSCILGGIRRCVMYSSDGINWASSTTPTDNNWKSVTYGNGLFVAVSMNVVGNQVMTSPDGINWTIRNTPPVNNPWQSITYGNGRFVAVADSGTVDSVMTSPDGINWTTGTAYNPKWQSVTYGNGLFVAVAYNGAKRVMTSSDGITWALPAVVPPLGLWRSVTYGNGLFVAVALDLGGATICSSAMSSYQCAMISPDGISWTTVTTPTTPTLGAESITYGNGLFVAVTANTIITSPDGTNWTVRASPTANIWRSVTYGNGLFVAVAGSGAGDRVMTSGKMDYVITPTNNIFQGGLSIMGPSTGILSIGTTTPMALITIATTTTSASGVSTSTAVFNITSGGLVGMGTSTLPKTALSVTGNFRMRDINSNRYTIDIYSSSGSSTFKTYNSISNTLMPLDLKASAINYTNYKTNQTWGTINTNADWYLGGSTTTGIRFSTNSATSTILKSQGNLLIADGGNNGYIYLQGDRVGIGTTTPQTKLQVIGNIKVGTPIDSGSIFNFDHACLAGSCMTSDIRLKKDFVSLTGSLDKIIQLNPVSYKWRADEFPELKLDGEKLNIGLIAQDVQKIYPELVSTDEKGYETINYGVDLSLHILEAIKELKAKNDALKVRAKILESKL